MRAPATTLVLLLAMWAGVSPAAEIQPLGEPFRISDPNAVHSSGPRLAVDREGGFTAIWTRQRPSSGAKVQVATYDRDGHVRMHREVEGFTPRDFGSDGLGNLVVVGQSRDNDSTRIFALRLAPDGEPIGGQVRVSEAQFAENQDPRVAVSSSGDFVVVWNDRTSFHNEYGGDVRGRLFDRQARPLGPSFRLSDLEPGSLNRPVVAWLSGGGFVAAWHSTPQDGVWQIFGRRFGTAGAPRGGAFPITISEAAPSTPRVAAASDGGFLLAWTRERETPGVRAMVARGFREDGSPLSGEVEVSAGGNSNASDYLVSVAALAEGRFVVGWLDAPQLYTSKLVVRIVDRRAQPVSPITDTGAESPWGTTSSFISRLAGSEFLVVWEEIGESYPRTAAVHARRLLFRERGEVCLPGPETLCLGDSRFEVRIEWRAFDGRLGEGTAFPLTGDSGLFSFFDPENLEMLVKVVDACAEFDRYWVFAAATTNVEYTMTVTDRLSGRSRTYFNPLGTRSPAITDTEAFDSCP
ncbi:MAG: hypothetical protein ABIV06_08790 [Thermoanaerobaculia bacterium]